MPSHLEALKVWLEFLKPMLSSVERFSYDGPESKQFWGIIKRAVIARQHEALQAIESMADAGHGFLGVTFLRPAYEELIWLEFVDGCVGDPADFAVLVSQHELADQLKTQNDYLDKRVMKEIGLSQRLGKLNDARDRETKKRIREIAHHVGWDTSRGLYPTTFFMAKRVNRLKEFQYLYGATSRFVHFSPHELMRRAWGRPGSLKIGSSSFAKYWETFAIYWGFRIFVNLLAHCHDLLTADTPDEKFDEMTRWLDGFNPVPIITREELEWSWPKV
jgi:hypothetical protein